MFRVLTPIIRSWYSCNYSFWYLSAGYTTIRSRCWVPTRMRYTCISTSSWSPAGNIAGALYHKLWIPSSAPEDGRNYRPKHVELIEIINNKIIIIIVSIWLFILLYQRGTVTQTSKIFLSAFVGWLVNWKNMHGVSYVQSQDNGVTKLGRRAPLSSLT